MLITSRACRLVAVLASVSLYVSMPVSAGEDSPDLLPDIIVPESWLYDQRIQRVGGRTLLRLSNGTANVGVGPLHHYGVTPGNGDGTQDVRQRIYREDGSYHSRLAGEFLYHQGHSHIHFNDWAHYRLRRRLGEDGVGDIVAEGDKVSFCILDLRSYDRDLPGYVPGGRYTRCNATVQGLSVGWQDIYDKNLPGQDIDITEVPDGHYWLESVVDPENHVLEMDETNNYARIPFTLGDPPDIEPDRYEPNDSLDAVRSLRVGSPNSPNLGPANPKLDLENLTLHEGSDVDFFRFYSNHVGAATDFVRVDFRSAAGNIGIDLLDDEGNLVERSATAADFERVSLEGRNGGWYCVRVFSQDGGPSPDYKLTINPPANQPPEIEVLTPTEGGVRLLHGLELYRVTWNATDPENDPLWVSVHLNHERVVDENLALVPTTIHTDAGPGLAIINTAEVEPGIYWVYCSITDGGSTVGSWSDGPLELVGISEECIDFGSPGDCNGNTVIDSCEIDLGFLSDCNGNGLPDRCEIDDGAAPDHDEDGVPDDCQLVPFYRGDANSDGSLDVSDAVGVIGFLFRGTHSFTCLEAADVNDDDELDVADVVSSLEFLFRAGAAPPPPGPPSETAGCGLDPDGPSSDGWLGCDEYSGC